MKFSADTLGVLFEILLQEGYNVIGPTLRNRTIVYEPIRSVAELPIGWTDEQTPGHYHVKPRDDGAYFGFNASPQSWRRYLQSPRERLWSADRVEGGAFKAAPGSENASAGSSRFAFIGVRSCELSAIEIQDRVFLESGFRDASYEAKRNDALIIVVNCGQACGTCFCVSMKTGPKAEKGFDLALTELIDGDRHEFLVEAGSSRGEELLSKIPEVEAASARDEELAEAAIQNAVATMGRALDTDGIKELLYRNLESPRWDEVASRCLTCANCTIVCPTCFCSTTEDTSDLTGNHVERWRRWDSCFSLGHSYLHGGSVRTSSKSRYRQWMTHKLATWYDQFGVSGCVGCGRCITWCPVGIDITEETRAIRELEEKERANHSLPAE